MQRTLGIAIASVLMAVACGSGGSAGAGGSTSSTSGSGGSAGGETGTGGMAAGSGGMAAGTGGMMGAGGMTGTGGAGGGPSCQPGSMMTCYSGPLGTAGVGSCKSGQATCAADGSYGPCVGEVLPIAENCATPTDDDCDGSGDPTCAKPLWARRFGEQGTLIPRDIAIGPGGEVTVVALLKGVCDIGSGPLVSSGPGADILLFQLDASGNYLWHVQMTGDQPDDIRPRVTVDGAGNVLIATSFTGKLDTGPLGALLSAGDKDIFLGKYNGSGKPLFIKRFGDPLTQEAGDVAADAAGNVALVGGAQGTVDLGKGPLTIGAQSDVVVAKYDSIGNAVFTSKFGDALAQRAVAVALDDAGNITLAGSFEGTLDLGGQALQSAGATDYFLARLDPAGKYVYARRFGDAIGQNDPDLALGVTGLGEATLAGVLFGSLDFGGGALTSAGGEDIFVATFAATSGEHLRSARYGDAGDQRALGVTPLSARGGVAVTGYSGGSVDFGGGTLTSAGGKDFFLATFESGGKPVWSRLYGDAKDQSGVRVALDPSGALVIAAAFSGSIDYGKGPVDALGATDLLIMKMMP
jgi:hypothetical protein